MRTQLPPDKVSELGRNWYNSKIKHELSDDQLGMDLAIEVMTGEYEIDGSRLELADRLHRRIPDAEVYLMKHGSFISYHLGCFPDVGSEDG